MWLKPTSTEDAMAGKGGTIWPSCAASSESRFLFFALLRLPLDAWI